MGALSLELMARALERRRPKAAPAEAKIMSFDHGFDGEVCPVCGMTRASLQPGGENYGRACVKPFDAATREAGYDSIPSEDEVDNVSARKDRGADDTRNNRM